MNRLAAIVIPPLVGSIADHWGAGAVIAPRQLRYGSTPGFAELRIEGASSHSGRRTFITNVAKKIVEAGGSLRDVQELPGHTSLATTQRYIQGDSEAKRNVIKLI